MLPTPKLLARAGVGTGTGTGTTCPLESCLLLLLSPAFGYFLIPQREGTIQEWAVPRRGAVHLLWAGGRGRAGRSDGSSGVTCGLCLSPASFSLLANGMLVFHFLLFPWSMLGVKWTNDSGSRRELE